MPAQSVTISVLVASSALKGGGRIRCCRAEKERGIGGQQGRFLADGQPGALALTLELVRQEEFIPGRSIRDILLGRDPLEEDVDVQAGELHPNF